MKEKAENVKGTPIDISDTDIQSLSLVPLFHFFYLAHPHFRLGTMPRTQYAPYTPRLLADLTSNFAAFTKELLVERQFAFGKRKPVCQQTYSTGGTLLAR